MSGRVVPMSVPGGGGARPPHACAPHALEYSSAFRTTGGGRKMERRNCEETPPEALPRESLLPKMAALGKPQAWAMAGTGLAGTGPQC